MSAPQFHRLGAPARARLRLSIDGRLHEAFIGDTVLTAILSAGRRARVSEFGDGARAGFCLMGLCQDCWVRLADGRRLRACTTPARDGMEILTDREPDDPGAGRNIDQNGEGGA